VSASRVATPRLLIPSQSALPTSPLRHILAEPDLASPENGHWLREVRSLLDELMNPLTGHPEEFSDLSYSDQIQFLAHLISLSGRYDAYEDPRAINRRLTIDK
jgi:hypothetical protein